jgi:hypothetical protein
MSDLDLYDTASLQSVANNYIVHVHNHANAYMQIVAHGKETTMSLYELYDAWGNALPFMMHAIRQTIDANVLSRDEFVALLKMPTQRTVEGAQRFAAAKTVGLITEQNQFRVADNVVTQPLNERVLDILVMANTQRDPSRSIVDLVHHTGLIFELVRNAQDVFTLYVAHMRAQYIIDEITSAKPIASSLPGNFPWTAPFATLANVLRRVELDNPAANKLVTYGTIETAVRRAAETDNPLLRDLPAWINRALMTNMLQAEGFAGNMCTGDPTQRYRVNSGRSRDELTLLSLGLYGDADVTATVAEIVTVTRVGAMIRAEGTAVGRDGDYTPEQALQLLPFIGAVGG